MADQSEEAITTSVEEITTSVEEVGTPESVDTDTVEIQLTDVLEKVDDIDEEDESKKAIVQNSDQDFNQKVTMFLLFVLELYRAIMSSLLIMFVPQKCDDDICDPGSKFFAGDNGYEDFVCAFNFVTLFCLIILYVFELKREIILINYLDINRFKPRNNDCVESELNKLSPNRKKRIENINIYHMYSGYSCIVLFSLNTVFSAAAVFGNYLGSETITVFLTNILFMSGKLYDVYVVTHTKKCVFFSSYLSRKIQFNDVDKDKVLVSD